jgi:hypothetical protein
VLEYRVVAISKPAIGVGVDGDSHRQSFSSTLR